MDKFLYVDLGNTVFDFKDSQRLIAARMGVGLEEFVQRWRGPDNRACKGDITTAQMWMEIGSTQDLTDVWLEGFKINQEFIN